MSNKEPVSRNRTIRYLYGSSIRRELRSVTHVPYGTFDDPTFVPRLAFHAAEFTQQQTPDFRETLKQVPPNVAIFLDTNIWDQRLDAELWPALLARKNSFYVVPSVRIELDPWIRSHSNLACSRAVLDEESPLIIQRPWDLDKNESAVYLYYVYLLQIRRKAYSLFEHELRKTRDHEPTEADVSAAIQRSLGERGLGLVRKYRKRAQIDKFATDESIVVLAAIHALKTGVPTIILTRDQDIIEQFYKLWLLLDRHYRAMLLADRYADDPLRFRMHKLPDHPRVRSLFEPERGLISELGADRAKSVLPKRFDFVSAECWFIGNGFTQFTFGAERQMNRLIQIKGSTGGLVSDRLDGRNLHPDLIGLPVGIRMCDSVAIVKDRTVLMSDGSTKVGYYDIERSINTLEIGSIHVAASKERQRLWLPRYYK